MFIPSLLVPEGEDLLAEAEQSAYKCDEGADATDQVLDVNATACVNELNSRWSLGLDLGLCLWLLWLDGALLKFLDLFDNVEVLGGDQGEPSQVIGAAGHEAIFRGDFVLALQSFPIADLFVEESADESSLRRDWKFDLDLFLKIGNLDDLQIT